MQPVIAKDVLDGLVALGRSRGHLTTEDLRQALPVDAMSPDDIALVVVHLEERGVTVELDEDLLAPHPGARAAPAGSPELVLPPESRTAPGVPAMPDTGPTAGGTTAAPERSQTGGLRPIHWAVGIAILLVVLVAVAIMLAR